MSARLGAVLRALDRRLLAGLLVGAILFMALEAWLLVLRAPLADWRSLAAHRAAAESAVPLAALTLETGQLTQALAGAEAQLRAAAPARSADDTVLALIGMLDPLAARHGVALGVVKAGARRPENGFEAVTFEIEASGPYLALVDWLSEAETQLQPLRVTALALSASDAGRHVNLSVKLTAYAPPQGVSGVAP